MSYLLTVNGRTLDAYTNLKLSEKRIKAYSWFEFEPQRLEFEFYDCGGGLGQEAWKDATELTYSDVLLIMNNSGYSFRGLSTAKVILYKDGSAIFTGYIDINQTDLFLEERKARIVCYDALRILSLLDTKENIDNVPYGFYTLAEFISNTWFEGWITLEDYPNSLTKRIEKIFPQFSLSVNLSGNLLTSPVEVSLNNKNTDIFENEAGRNYVGFFQYAHTEMGKTINHLFFAYFQVYVASAVIYKKIKITEIVNGYCYVDPVYSDHSENTYENTAEALSFFDTVVLEQYDLINNSVPGWNDWFSLPAIQNSFQYYGYTYEYAEDIYNYKEIIVTGNIISTWFSVGDNKEFHKPLYTSGYSIRYNYSNKTWLSVLRDFIIANNLVMTTNQSGNIDIKNYSPRVLAGLEDYIVTIKKSTKFPDDFPGVKSIDGNNIEAIDHEVAEYYHQYFEFISVYSVTFRFDGDAGGIARTLNVLDAFVYDGNTILLTSIDIDIDTDIYKCEGIQI